MEHAADSSNVLKPITSTLIQAYSYDPATQVLSIVFNRDPDTTHQYSGVSGPVMSQVFDSPGSVGGNFHRLIKRGNYRHSIAQD